MLEFYKTYGTVTKKLEQPEPGCWISAVAPTQEDIDFLTNKIGVLPEFIKSSLDEEESSHIDYDDDENQTLVIVDYPSAEEDDNLDEKYPAVYHAATGCCYHEGLCDYDFPV